MLQTQHGKLKYPSDPLPPLKKFSGSAHVSRQPFYIFLLFDHFGTHDQSYMYIHVQVYSIYRPNT